MSAASKRYRLRDGVLAQTSLAEAVLLDAQKGSYFGANPSATVLLRALVEGADEAAMLAALRAAFDADEAALRSDLHECLRDWRARGLIVEREDS